MCVFELRPPSNCVEALILRQESKAGCWRYRETFVAAAYLTSDEIEKIRSKQLFAQQALALRFRIHTPGTQAGEFMVEKKKSQQLSY